MKQYNITMQADIFVEFDETSEEFKELWENYLKYFDSNADYESFSANIASLIARYGTNEFIEGVGYVKLNGKNQKFFGDDGYKEYHGIVNVEVDTDLNSMVDFEVSNIEEL